MENMKIRRLWASLTMVGLMITQFTTGVFPIPISPTDAAYAAGFFIEKERIDADEDEPVGPGDTIRYEITIRNNDTKTANARIIDPVPQYLEFVSGTNSCYYENQTDEVICAQQPLNVGATRTERITFKVKSNAPQCTTIENQADVWNDDANPPSGIAPSWSNVVETPTDCDEPELEITKTANKTDLEPGEQIRYTLTAKNIGTGTATNVRILDQIPNGLVFDSGASDNRCSQVSNKIECDLSSLSQGQSKSVNIYFNVDSTLQPSNPLCGGNIVNIAQVTAGNATTVSSQSVVTPLHCPAPELQITKTANKTALQPGDQIRYTLTGKNIGDGTATNVRILDQIPNGLVFDSGASDNRCSQVSNKIECDLTSLNANQTKSLNIYFDVDPNIQAGHNLCGTNIINIGQITAGNATTQSSQSVVTPLTCPAPKLDVTKTGPSSVTAGSDVTYSFTVKNTGDAIANNVHAYDFFIDNNTQQRINPPFTFKSSSGASCTYKSADKFWDCTVGNLNPNQTKTFTMTFEVPDNVPALCGTTVMNNVDVHLNGVPTSTPASDWDKHQVSVNCLEPKLDLNKTGPSSVVAGDDITYTFTVKNTGNGVATDVRVSDRFVDGNDNVIWPMPFTYKSASGANCSLSTQDQRVFCYLGDINPNQTKTYTLTFETPDAQYCGDTIMNKADAHVNQKSGPASDWDSHQVHVTCVQSDTQLKITKSANKNSAEHLEMITYTLNVENIGNATAENVVVVDPVPSNTMFLDGQSDSHCDLVSNNVICDGFDLAPGEDRDLTLVFKVLDTAPCDGTIANRADAHADNAATVWSNQVDVDVDCDDPSFEVVKRVDKSVIQPNGRLTYEIEVENTGPITLKGLWIIDTVPTHLTYNDAASDSRCFLQGNDVKCGDDDIAPGAKDTYTLVFDVKSNAQCGGYIENDAYIVFIGHNNLDGNTNTVRTDIECNNPDLELTKSADKQQAKKGDTVKYTLTLKNNGTGTAYNAFVLDDVISEFTFLPLQSSAQCDINGNTIECGPTDLAPNATKTYTIAFEVNNSATCDSTVYNQAEAVADNHGSVLSNSEDVDIVCDDPEADLKVIKSGPSQIMRGTVISYEVRVINMGPDTAEDIEITDLIPKVLKQDTANYLDLTFNSGQSDNSCYKSGTKVICGGFDLANGDSYTFNVAFNVPSDAFCAKPILNEVSVKSDTFDPISSNNDDDHLSTVNCATGTLDIHKDGPSTTRRGNTITYTVTATNNLSFKVTKNRVIDPVPEHLQFVSANDNLCYYENQTDEVICGEFDLNPGQSRTFQLTFKVLSSAPCNNDIINIADAWSNHGGVNPQWSNAVKTKVLCDAQLEIEKTDNQTTVAPGARYTYEIYVSNVSSSDAQDIIVTDKLPNGVSFVSANAGGSYNNATRTVSWTLDVDANDVEVLTVTVDADNVQPGDVIYNEACIKNGPCDDDTTTVPHAEFTISKTDGRTTAARGDTLTYTVSVTNISSIDAKDVEILDSLPDDVTFISANRNGSFNSNTDEVTWTVDIDAGDTETFEVTVKVDNTANHNQVLQNIACVGNECDDDNTTVLVPQDPILTISKTDHRSTVAPGETLIYDIEVSNISGVDAVDVEVIDTLPDDVTFVSADFGGSHSNGEVTWTIDVDAGETVLLTVEVDVDSNAQDGTFLYNYVEITGGPNDDDTTKVIVDDKFGCIDIIKETYDTSGSPLTPVTQFTFYLDGNAQTVQNSSNGRARFNNVPVGSHTVTENLPSTWKQVSVTPSGGQVTVIEGSGCSTVTFKNQQNFGDDDEDFTISKTDNQSTTEPGERLTYEITVRNVGNVDATDVEVTDDLPNNVDYVSSSDNGSHSNGTVRWFIDLDAGESKTLTVRVDVDNSADDGDRILNEACVENFDCDDDTTTVVVDDDDDEDQDDDDDDNGEVTISVNDDPDPVDICHDDDLEYEIRLSNSSNANREVDVIAYLDGDTDYRSSSDGGDERSGDRVEWDDIRVSRNSSKELRLRVRVSSGVRDGDTLRLRVAVSDGDEDTEVTRVRNNCDNDDDDDTYVPGNPQLTLDKTADRTEALPGSLVSYTITIRNPGNEDIRNANLVDNYPESYIVISDSGGASDTGSELRWSLGTLRANSTTVVRYRVRLRDGIAKGTRITNVATVTGDGLTATDDHTVVVPQPPQTGLGGFIKSLTLSDSYTSESRLTQSSSSQSANAVVAVRPQARNADTVIDAVPSSNNETLDAVAAEAAAATVPLMVWMTTMIAGLGMGGMFGRRFLF